MSSQNIAVVHRIYETFETRDFATFFSLLSPEVQITQCHQLPFGGDFHGHEGAKAFFGKVGSYIDSHVTIERIIDAEDRIVMIGQAYGTAKSTGKSFNVQIMHLWELKKGKVVRLEIALDVAAMLAPL